MKKNYACCSVLQGNPAVASSNEQLYEQMTSNPAFTERNIQKPNAYLLDSHSEQKSLVTYHTLRSLYICVWLVNTLTSTADWISNNLHVISSRYLQTMGKELSFSSADVHGARTHDEQLRTSVWEAKYYADRRNHARDRSMGKGDAVLLETRKENKLSVSYECMP